MRFGGRGRNVLVFLVVRLGIKVASVALHSVFKTHLLPLASSPHFKPLLWGVGAVMWLHQVFVTGLEAVSLYPLTLNQSSDVGSERFNSYPHRA